MLTLVKNQHKCNDFKTPIIYYDSKKDLCRMDVPYLEDSSVKYVTIIIEYCPFCGDYLGPDNNINQ